MLSINKIYQRYSICGNIPSANTNTEQFVMIRENSSNKLIPCAFCQICNHYTISTSTTTVSSTATVCHGTNDHNYLCKTGNLRKNSETKKFINDVNRVNHHEEKKKERTIRSLQSIASSSSNYEFEQLTRLKRVQITSGPPREQWIPNKNPPPVERHPVVPPRSAQAPDVHHHAAIIEDVIAKEAPTELGGEDGEAVPQAALEEAPTEPVVEPVVNDPPPLLEDDVIICPDCEFPNKKTSNKCGMCTKSLPRQQNGSNDNDGRDTLDSCVSITLFLISFLYPFSFSSSQSNNLIVDPSLPSCLIGSPYSARC